MFFFCFFFRMSSATISNDALLSGDTDIGWERKHLHMTWLTPKHPHKC